jgi:hypothetical protein
MRLRMSSREVVIRELSGAINMVLLTEHDKLYFGRLPCNYLTLNQAVAGEYFVRETDRPNRCRHLSPGAGDEK